MGGYVDNFHCTLFHMYDTAPVEVLDCYLHGLHPSVCMQVLVANPNIFAHAALLAEHVAVAYGEATHNGPQPMDLGALQGSGIGVA